MKGRERTMQSPPDEAVRISRATGSIVRLTCLQFDVQGLFGCLSVSRTTRSRCVFNFFGIGRLDI